MTLLRNLVFADGPVMMRSLKWSLIQYNRWPYKKRKFEHRDRHTKGILCEDTGKGGHLRPGIPEAVSSEEKAWNRFSLTAP